MLAAEQGGKYLALIAGAVFAAMEAVIDGMADFLQQHRLQLADGSALQPIGIYVNAFATLGCGAGVGTVNAAEAGGGPDFQGYLQPGPQQAGLQRRSWLFRGRVVSGKHLLEQGVEGV